MYFLMELLDLRMQFSKLQGPWTLVGTGTLSLDGEQ